MYICIFIRENLHLPFFPDGRAWLTFVAFMPAARTSGRPRLPFGLLGYGCLHCSGGAGAPPAVHGAAERVGGRDAAVPPAV